MKKRLIASATCLCLLLIMLLSSTLAWFTDQTETSKSTMTVGNVAIAQLEQYRKYNEDGTFDLLPWHTADSSYTPKMYPAVHLGSDVPLGQEVELYGQMYSLYNQGQNVIDKIVSVRNIGADPAYVRTVFAFEMMWTGTEWENPIGDEIILNCNANQRIIFPQTADGKDIVIYRPDKSENGSDDAAFVIGFATYSDVLESGYVSVPSLLQLYLNQNVNDDDAFRTSVGGEYEVLVLSQAVQTAGFEKYGALVALNEAFGDVTAHNAAKWFGAEYAGAYVHTIKNIEDLDKAFEVGGHGVIENMNLTDVQETLAEDKTLRLDMNTSTLSGTDEEYVISNYGTLQIYGDGTIVNNMKGSIENWGILYINKLNIDVKGDKYGFHCKDGEVEINDLVLTAQRGGINVQGGKVTINSGSITTTAYNTNTGYYVFASLNSEVVINGGDFRYEGTYYKHYALYAASGATITVNGGTFGKGGSNIQKRYWISAENGGSVIIYGGRFEFDPSDFVAEGYQAVQGEDGWWTVSKIVG